MIIKLFINYNNYDCQIKFYTLNFKQRINLDF